MNASIQKSNTDAPTASFDFVSAGAPRFELGRLLSTPGAIALMQDSQVDPMSLLRRHVRGDWGTVCAEDALSNEAALQCGDRLLSSYLMPGGGLIWIITEADRSATACLRPDEY